MQFSSFSRKFGVNAGINELMDDLGKAMEDSGRQGALKAMFGGGNPAAIPELSALWRSLMKELLDRQDDFDRMLVNYDTPQGKGEFLEALAGYLNQEYSWNLGPENIAVTNGSQSAFFFLFNILAGKQSDGSRRRILFPLVPEYIGYADQSLFADDFKGLPARIKDFGEHRFKYYLNTEELQACMDQEVPGRPEIGALCVSRPSNPTGNVLEDGEISFLNALCKEKDIPLLVDNAYGQPFPGLMYTPAHLSWNEHTVLTMSLSKLGLPATRTGIIIARPELIKAVSSMNAIMSLANGSLGQTLVLPLIKENRIQGLCSQLILPWYKERRDRMLVLLDEAFQAQGIPYRIHESQGAFFLWLYFPWMQGAARKAYERLKEKGVLIVPGDSFFFGLEGQHREWGRKHGSSCMRLSFARPDKELEEGCAILAEVLGQMYKERL